MAVNPQPTPQAHAFAESALRRYSRQLHDFLRRRIRRTQDLDDLAQEVYLRLLRVKGVEEVRNPLAYIYGVASHVASEFGMREVRARVLCDSPLLDALANEEAENADWQGAESGGYVEKRVGDALGELSDKHLAVLLLERRDGLSQNEIAEKLGLSPHTVKKYSVQALAHIRASMEP